MARPRPRPQLATTTAVLILFLVAEVVSSGEASTIVLRPPHGGSNCHTMFLPLFLSLPPSSSSRNSSPSVRHQIQGSDPLHPNTRMPIYDDLLLNGVHTGGIWDGPMMNEIVNSEHDKSTIGFGSINTPSGGNVMPGNMWRLDEEIVLQGTSADTSTRQQQSAGCFPTFSMLSDKVIFSREKMNSLELMASMTVCQVSRKTKGSDCQAKAMNTIVSPSHFISFFPSVQIPQCLLMCFQS